MAGKVAAVWVVVTSFVLAAAARADDDVPAVNVGARSFMARLWHAGGFRATFPS